MKSITIERIEPLNYSASEALNTIASNLSFAGRDVKKILFTSVDQNAGKSFLTLQLAKNMAERGKRVILLDADIRKSYLLERCRIDAKGEVKGLVHYLAGYNNLNDIVYQTNIYGLDIIPVGRNVANPIQLLTSPYFSLMMNQLAENYDLVLVDTPPIGVVIDAAEIAQSCDGAVLVLEYNLTRRQELIDAKKQIEQAGCAVLGGILNKMEFDSMSNRKYYNRYYYKHYSSSYYKKKSKNFPTKNP